ncbi:hypothetical protein KIH23_04870 [Flavobacterium sp. CYK-55]|uniref:helix-turn-helix domain-containing protein n=1 Tax=Flavobacterium sp. CYK-55 TaxID=2835529 RepID=UPI001BCEEF54|nr:helix-turn-helix transcriptional regulator [Flavobacterium sp. CYK-55]MBS7786620.1 hypothetical protein [Flavobacterium sp. CYK-55]
MKKQHPFRTMLGLTQQEIAMLLGVSRSQWAMHELGQRDLPLEAQQLLAEMLTALQPVVTQRKAPVPSLKQLKETQRRLNRVQERLVHFERQLAKTQEQERCQENRRRLAEYFSSHKKHQTHRATGVANLLLLQAPKPDETVAQLAHQQHRLEILGLEEKILKATLKQLERQL